MISAILKAIGWLALWVVILVVGFMTYSYFKEYSPQNIEDLPIITTNAQQQSISKDTITLLSWNIGYAGLGDDMDFFMDGGESSRTSKGRTLENLNGIIDYISTLSGSLDFILLQEVDKSSKRSYGINEYDTIVSRFGREFATYFAANFKVFYVPIPLGDAIGTVHSGLVTLSRYSPVQAQRISLPKDGDFPQSMFNLKRCMLSLAIPTSSGDTLHITNSHNSAYDDGDLRAKEMQFISDFLAKQSSFVIAGDWNSNPVGYAPTKAEQENEYFVPAHLAPKDFSSEYHYAVDLRSHTARYGYEPYIENKTTTTLIDFALSSSNITPIKVECIDMGFKFSDHNPVIYTFVISE